jgi:hypothetical protein
MAWVIHRVGCLGTRRMLACLLLPVFLSSGVPSGACCCGSSCRVANAVAGPAASCCRQTRAACPKCRAKAGTNRGLVSVRGEHAPVSRCRCQARADFDLPKQVSSLAHPVLERALLGACNPLPIRADLVGDSATRLISKSGPPIHAGRVIALCRLVI